MITQAVELDNPDAQKPSVWILGLLFALFLHGIALFVILSRPPVFPQGLENFDAISVDLDVGVPSVADGDGERLDSAATDEPVTNQEPPVPEQETEAEQQDVAPDEPSDQAAVAQSVTPETPAVAETPEEILPEVPPVEKAEVVLPAAQEKPETPEKPQAETKPEKPVERPRTTNRQAESRRPARSEPRPSGGAAAPRGGGSATGVFTPHPAFPRSARARGISYGRVTVRFTISATGSVSSVSVISAQPPGVFESATTSAVSRWRFTAPGSPVTRTQTFHFVLR